MCVKFQHTQKRAWGLRWLRKGLADGGVQWKEYQDQTCCNDYPTDAADPLTDRTCFNCDRQLLFYSLQITGLTFPTASDVQNPFLHSSCQKLTVLFSKTTCFILCHPSHSVKIFIREAEFYNKVSFIYIKKTCIFVAGITKPMHKNQW